MKRPVSCFVIVFAAMTLLAAQAGDAALAKGLRLVEESRTTLAEPALDQARDYFATLAKENPNQAASLYQLARIDFYRGNAADLRGDKKSAVAAMELAIGEAQASLKADEHSAVAHSLLADLYGRRIGLGGFMLGPRLGPKIVAENKRALELDGNNAVVLAAVGRQYLMAPKMFGGNVEKAIENLQKSTQLDPRADETFVWLARAYREKGDAASANKALDEALRLNPRSVFAQNTKAGK